MNRLSLLSILLIPSLAFAVPDVNLKVEQLATAIDTTHDELEALVEGEEDWADGLVHLRVARNYAQARTPNSGVNEFRSKPLQFGLWLRRLKSAALNIEEAPLVISNRWARRIGPKVIAALKEFIADAKVKVGSDNTITADHRARLDGVAASISSDIDAHANAFDGDAGDATLALHRLGLHWKTIASSELFQYQFARPHRVRRLQEIAYAAYEAGGSWEDRRSQVVAMMTAIIAIIRDYLKPQILSGKRVASSGRRQLESVHTKLTEVTSCLTQLPQGLNDYEYMQCYLRVIEIVELLRAVQGPLVDTFAWRASIGEAVFAMLEISIFHNDNSLITQEGYLENENATQGIAQWRLGLAELRAGNVDAALDRYINNRCRMVELYNQYWYRQGNGALPLLWVLKCTCGNEEVQQNEQCDDGNLIDNDSCTNNCQNAACGDGILYRQDEVCDDGNSDAGDGCSPTCQREEVCGDGRREGREQCDDANIIETDSCRNSCRSARCGDGVVYAAQEHCDDANAENNDDCKNDCTLHLPSASLGGTHSCFHRQGKVWCSGYGYHGALGNGANVDSAVPVPVLGLTDVTQTAAGYYHHCALRENGSVMCWGYGAHGQLGQGAWSSTNRPVEVRNLGDVVELNASHYTTCARKRDGSVWCWGYNYWGDLGIGHNGGRNTPQRVLDLDGATELSGGVHHHCALIEGGRVKCWGRGTYRQVTNTGQEPERVVRPVLVPNIVGAEQLVSGGYSNCILKSGRIYCFGFNEHGQMGDGSTSRTKTGPIEVSGVNDAVEIASGYHHYCLRRTDGTVWCWAYNGHGQLGDGTRRHRYRPVRVRGISNAISLWRGGVAYGSCAGKADASMWCWGYGSNGRLGTGSTIWSQPSPRLVLTISPARCGDGVLQEGEACDDGNANEYDACRNNCRLSACGDGVQFAEFEQCDDGNQVNTDDCRNDCVNGSCGNGDMDEGEDCDDGNWDNDDYCPNDCRIAFPRASLGLENTCFLRNGKVWCSGFGEYGGIGNGANEDSSVPLRVSNINTARSVASGRAHSCAAKADGTVWCWGTNNLSQLGQADTPLLQSNVPVQVQNLTNILDVQAMYNTTCALSASRQVFCWGAGRSGQLGNAGFLNSSMPVQVRGISDAVQITSGTDHACLLLSTGGIRCWGYGGYGQISNSDEWLNSEHTPITPANLPRAAEVRAYGYGTCLRTAQGSVYCWGYHHHGQVGDGSSATARRLGQNRVRGLDDAVQLASGRYHNCALRRNGTVVCWGGNWRGQLGVGDGTTRLTAVQVADLNRVKSIYSGASSYGSCAVKRNGEIWCWGDNQIGRLGLAHERDVVRIPELVRDVIAPRCGDGSLQLSEACDDGNRDSGDRCLNDCTLAACGDGVIRRGIEQCDDANDRNDDDCSNECVLTTCGNGEINEGEDCDDGNNENLDRCPDDCRLPLPKAAPAGDHSCFLIEGKIHCSGQNRYGTLGNNSNENSTTLVRVAGIDNAVDVVSGYYHSCAALETGEAKCWGYNAQGQLGNGTNVDAKTPSAVLHLTNVVEVTASHYASCARKSDGSVWCWGAGWYGQMGNGDHGSRQEPVRVRGIDNATRIEGGVYHFCALRSDDSVSCWGRGYEAQVANDATRMNSYATPEPVSGGSDIIDVAVGGYTTCMLKSDGTVVCYGYNYHGEMGMGTRNNAEGQDRWRVNSTPIPNLTGVVEIAAGYRHFCARKGDGSAYCWGYGAHGQVGDGSRGLQPTPLRVPEINDFRSLWKGGVSYMSCGSRSDGSLWCWGANWYGHMGLGHTQNQPVPTRIEGLLPRRCGDGIRQVGEECDDANTSETDACSAACLTTYCGDGLVDAEAEQCDDANLIDDDDCRNNCALGTCGNGDLDEGEHCDDANTSDGDRCPGNCRYLAPQVTTGYAHTCYVLSGRVHCTGQNNFGQLGNNTIEDSNAVVSVMGINDATKVTAGHYHSCAVRSGGGVKCWGYGQYGQLGDGTNENRTTPRDVTGVTDAIDIAASIYTTCALRSGGSVQCWGVGWYGGTGVGDHSSSTTPRPVVGLSNVVSLHGGNYHFCARLRDGTLRCWGSGHSAEVANDATRLLSEPTPRQPLDVSGATDLVSGGYTNCILKADGKVYCFGYNHHGELGRGNRSLDSPNYMTGSVAVAGLTDVVEVGGGRHFFCARRSNGTVWCWGYGSHGQSGNGTNTTDGTARQVRGIDDAVALSSGSTGYAMCAARRNGSVWCWGGNWRGQLGTEHNYNTNEPVQMRLRGAMRCGDGELEGNETCDDGNALDSDACLNNCRLSRCGDGYVRNAMEQCDDGNDINNDSCRNDCVLGSCGNARVDAGEFCDDGNTENWDNCPNDCRLQVPDVTAGGHHMCFRRTGKIFCTGRNHYGELGDGSNDDRNVPVVVRNITTAVAHSSGYYHHCAALSSGRVMCWGYGAHGQMGNETYDNSNVPVLVSNITDVEKLGASHYATCAVRRNGEVWCWGYGGYGQLGNGTGSSSSLPRRVSGINNAVDVQGGVYHFCAKLADNSMRCWGRSYYGTVSNDLNLRGNYSRPYTPSGMGQVSQIAVGGHHNCALKADGQVLCFGYDNHGELGQNSRTTEEPQFRAGQFSVNLSNVSELAAGYHHTCARRSNGTVWCWGYNAHGQVGDRTNTTNGTPRQVDGLTDANSLWRGGVSYASCAGKRDGSVWCWGNNSNGALGIGDQGHKNWPQRVVHSAPPRCGDGQLQSEREDCDDGNSVNTDACLTTCRVARCGDSVVRADKEQCDDGNSNNDDACRNDCVLGSCGNGSVDAGEQCDDGNTVRIDTCDNNCRKILPDSALTHTHHCYLRAGKIYCSGEGSSGALGDGQLANSERPVLVQGLNDAVDHSGGTGHHCAVRENGSMQCWGDNGYGQLGAGDLNGRSEPTNVVDLAGVEEVASMRKTTCARKVDGTVSCWGWGANGGNGDGMSRANRSRPNQVPQISGAIQLKAGWDHACVLKANGRIYCWGYGGYAQVTNEDNRRSSYVGPQQVGGNLPDAVEISAGGYNNCMRRANGRVYCWGYNWHGEAGQGNNSARHTGNVPVRNLSDAVELASGRHHHCARRANETVMCWGYNSYGNLGDNTRSHRYAPVAVVGLTRVKKLFENGTGMSSCATRFDGAIWCWGNNDYGQYGVGNTQQAIRPTLIDQMIPPRCGDGDLQLSEACDDGNQNNTDGCRNDCTMARCGDGVVHVGFEQCDDGNANNLDDCRENCVLGNCGNSRVDVGEACDDGNSTDDDLCRNDCRSGLPQVATGKEFTCFERHGRVFCVGRGNSGQLGNRSRQSRDGIGPVEGLDGVRSLAAGAHHNCASRKDGTVWCWGQGNFGQLGNGATRDIDYPIEVANLSDITQVVAGYDSTCALRVDGAVFCFGYNGHGQIGDGSNGHRNRPTRVLDLPTGANKPVEVTAGIYHYCARLTDGSLRCWGNNSGIAVTNRAGAGAYNRPQTPSDTGTTVQITAGRQSTCVRRSDNNLLCWGQNADGEAGIGNQVNPKQGAALAQIDNVAQIASHDRSTCAIKTNGNLYCWGYNRSGTLGVGDNNDRFIPAAVPGISGVSHLAVGPSSLHVCAVKNDGSVWCWGRDNYGALGVESDGDTNAPELVQGIAGAPTCGDDVLQGNEQCDDGNDSQSDACRNDCILNQCGDGHRFAAQEQCDDGNNNNGDGCRSDCVLSTCGNGQVEEGEDCDDGNSLGGDRCAYDCRRSFPVAATGVGHSCFLRSGNVWCSGSGSAGQLGDGTNRESVLTPVPVVGLSNVVEIAAGAHFNCAIKSDSSVWCWGDNEYGQLGDGSTQGRNRPVRVSGLTQAKSLGLAYRTACAVKSNGTIFCWGYGGHGQIGRPGSGHERVPTQVADITNAVQVTGGVYHLCARLSDGGVRCWAYNAYRQVTNTTNQDTQRRPVAPAQISGAVDVTSGGYHSCVLREDGRVYCWGYNNHGETGRGTRTRDAIGFVAVSGITNAVELSAGHHHSCARLSDNSIKCWGANWHGQLGDGSTSHRPEPVSVSNISDARRLSRGGSGYHTCASRSDGSLWCWGHGSQGLLGNGLNVNSRLPVRVLRVSEPRCGDGIMQNNETCDDGNSVDTDSCLNSCRPAICGDGVTRAGTEQCDDGNANNDDACRNSCALPACGNARLDEGEQCDDGNNVAGDTCPANCQFSLPTPAPGGDHGCFLRSGEVFCSGYNRNGAVGDGGSDNRTSPYHITSLSGATDLGSGYHHSCAVMPDTSVKCWGINTYGQLGDDSETNRNRPVTVRDLNGVKAVIGGNHSTCALKHDGSVWCWGVGWYGQLGNGSHSSRSTPSQVMGLNDAISLRGGAYFYCALRRNQRLTCWGHNSYGQISGSESDLGSKSAPTEPIGLGDVSDFSTAGYHTCVLRAGRVACFGYNHHGELGRGTNNSSEYGYTNIDGLTNVVELMGSRHTTCARKTDASVWCWGYNGHGQIGDGSTSHRNRPVQVIGIDDALSLNDTAGSGYSSCAVRADRQIWCWGHNGSGLLGVGNPNNQRQPVLVPGSRQNVCGDGLRFGGEACDDGNRIDTDACLNNCTAAICGDSVVDATREQCDDGNASNDDSCRNNCVRGSCGNGVVDAGEACDDGNILDSDRCPADCRFDMPFAALGHSHTCYTRGGKVFCAGDGNEGALGNGSTSSTAVYQEVSGLTDVIETAGGGYYHCALKRDGSVWCWGQNNNGQLGDDTTTKRTRPVRVKNLDSVTQITGAHYAACALRTDSTVWCWGAGSYGALGQNGGSSRVPVRAVGVNSAVQISAGIYHVCALLADRSLTCWGYNARGNISNDAADLAHRSSARSVSGMTDIAEVATGAWFTCVRKTNGTVSCFGYNHHGQAGNGEVAATHFAGNPVTGINNAVELRGGHLHACARLADNSMRCWGYNGHGELGDGTTSHRSTPVQPAIADVVHLAKGHASYDSCVTKANGTLWCWGRNYRGALGLDNTYPRISPMEVRGAAEARCGDGVVRQNEQCDDGNELDTDGCLNSCRLATCGDGIVATGDEQCDDGNQNNADVCRNDCVAGSCGNGRIDAGEQCDDGNSVATDRCPNNCRFAIPRTAQGDQHKCWLSQGAVRCSGVNRHGQLGNGTNQDSLTPVAVTGISDGIAISSGTNFVCALRVGGSIKCWGENYDGQLGNGANTSSNTAVDVQGIDNAVEINLALRSGCARLDTGRIKCWGYGGYGTLGNGRGSSYNTPQAVSGITNAVQIAGGHYRFCATLADQTARCWGYGHHHQVANTAELRSWNTPQQPALIGDVAQIVTGHYHTCSLRRTGRVNCFGRNHHGEIGDGTKGDPKHGLFEVSGLTDIVELAAGYYHTCARKRGGSIWCWGYNGHGELGVGHRSHSPTPVQVVGIDDAVALWDSGLGHGSCATRAGGSIYCWGRNSVGQMGTGFNYWSEARPVRVPTVGAPRCGDGTITDGEGCDDGNEIDSDRCLNSCQVASCGDSVVQTDVEQCDDGNQNDGDSCRNNCALATCGNNRLDEGEICDDGNQLDGDRCPSNCSFSMPHNAPGGSHACWLNEGKVWCAGDNAQGQLGGTVVQSSSVPLRVGNITDAIDLASGYYHSCMVRRNGTVWCWGYNSHGELGNGANRNSTSPVQVIGLSDVVEIATTHYGTCARKADSTLWCWGYGGYGALGDGQSRSNNRPSQVANVAGVIDHGGGVYHACAVLSDNSVRCWGYGGYGQVGNDDSRRAHNPLPLTPANSSGALEIGVGGYSTCIRRAPGTVHCWGYNAHGQMGNGTTGDYAVGSLQVSDINNATELASGYHHHCALLSDKTVSCWGYDGHGQLGQGFRRHSNVPVSVTDLTSVERLWRDSVTYSSCATTSEGRSYCWGNGSNGRLGIGDLAWSQPQPTAVIDVAQERCGDAQISGDEQCDDGNTADTDYCRNSCRLASCGDGVIQVGVELCDDGNSSDDDACSNRCVPSSCGNSSVDQGEACDDGNINNLDACTNDCIKGVPSAGMGRTHTCWVRGGAVWCAGWGASGAIGDGNTTNRNSATRVSGIRNAVGTIGGDGHQCANLSDGTVKCWGFGGHGQLGNGANTNQTSPVVVRDLSGIVQLAATHNTTCARKSNGRVWCWGSNDSYNLGIGQSTTTATNVPMRAAGVDAATSLRSGANHFCVMIGDNTARCWGHNWYYQSSNNSDRGARPRAVTVAGIGEVIAIEPGGYFSCALKANGQVLCWGYNHHGELGRGTNGTEQLGAQAVQNITTATAIAAGRHHACALLADRTMKCWGYNGVGELGDGSWSHRNTPVVVRDLSNVVKMDFNGLEHASCATTAGLGMYCWGRNDQGGKLGLGHESNRNTPQRVPMVSIGN